MRVVILLAIAVVCFSCEPKQGQQVEEAPPMTTSSSNLHEIVVLETIQAKNYTYLKADENGKEVWIAILKTDVEIGKTYYYGQAMEMKNFKSKDLDRTFESVLFLEGLLDNPQGQVTSRVMAPNDEAHKTKGGAPRQEMNIQHEEGETSIGELFESKESLQNKKVTVKGIVTKYNPDIMNKNWIHIQDGTGGPNSFDLTITTNDQVKVGSIVILEGIVTLNKDFGHGYKYDLIIEDAVLLNNKPEVKIN